MTQALRGIATISLWAADHNAAVKWYGELLGTKAYFERPGYAEFRIGITRPRSALLTADMPRI